jgi:multicomponent Na+:H+ antiporter subunit E
LVRTATIVVFLACVWLLWSGHTEPLILSFGAASVALVTWIAWRMDRTDGQATGWGLGLRPLVYIPWLLLEILKSNLHVAAVILTPKMPIQPRLLRVHVTQKTDLGQVVYANSITLTPGTITLDVRNDEFLVHALTDEVAEGLLTGDMDRKCTWLEGN